MKQEIALNINGDTYELLVSPNQTLLEVLRDNLGLMGTKRGCDLGACGGLHGALKRGGLSLLPDAGDGCG